MTRVLLSGVLSGASLLLPFWAPLWMPGVLFGALVCVPSARARGRRRVGTALAFLLALVGWSLAVFGQLASLAPNDLPYAAWTALSGLAGGSAAAVGVLGLASWRLLGRVAVAALAGGLVGGLAGILLTHVSLHGWGWVTVMCAIFVAWQASLWVALSRAPDVRALRAAASTLLLVPFSLLVSASQSASSGANARDDGPRVVATHPELHDLLVDPALSEVTFEFDRDMHAEPPGLVALASTAPLTDRPTWRDARTMVVPVGLEAGREYALAINVGGRRNLRDTAERPAQPFVLAWRTSGQDAEPGPAGALDPELNRRSREELARALARDYSHRDRLGVDWAGRVEAFAARLDNARTIDEFGLWTTALLAAAEDGHLWFRRDGSMIPTWYQRAFTNAPESPAGLVPRYLERSPFHATGRFDGGIGYLRLSSFSTLARGTALAALRTAWQLFGRGPLVIDVRTNGGGDESLGLLVAGCFVPEPRVYARHVRPDRDVADGFGPPTPRVLRPLRFAPRHTGPVAVLMGPRNVSSCEAFLMMMQQVEGARLFGAPTRGSSGNPRQFVLANGAEFWIPSWKTQTPDGRDVEGIGVRPDVFVPTRPGDFDAHDPVLEAALEWLRSPSASGHRGS